VCAGLLALADVVPRSTTLIVGGSLARGEATFVPTTHGYELASDLDLLIVYESTLPPMSVKHFLALARRSLPTTTI
jgi:predicted nucleotidyltransferase